MPSQHRIDVLEFSGFRSYFEDFRGTPSDVYQFKFVTCEVYNPQRSIYYSVFI